MCYIFRLEFWWSKLGIQLFQLGSLVCGDRVIWYWHSPHVVGSVTRQVYRPSFILHSYHSLGNWFAIIHINFYARSHIFVPCSAMDPEEDNPDHLKRFAKFLIFVLIKILVLSSIDFWVSFDMILTHTLDWDQNILNIARFIEFCRFTFSSHSIYSVHH